MTLPSSGSLSLSQVRGEHGGSLPLSMSQLLRNSAQGSLVYSTNTAIPAAAPLDLSDFRGTSRSGYYPLVVGRWDTGGGSFQQGYAPSGGSLLYNYNFKGYTLQSVAWNETTDGLVAVGFTTINVPQSILSTLRTAKLGTRSVTAYYPDFFGVTLFIFGSTSTSPFSSVGSTDTSVLIY